MPSLTPTPAAAPARVAIYTRSRPSRDTAPGLSAAGQEAVLRAYLASRPGWRLVATYHDEGDPRRRPALAHALAEARCGRFDRLLIGGPYQLSRRVRTLAACLHGFTDAGVAVHCADGALDTATPAGRLALAVLTACAQVEANNPGAHRRRLTAAGTTGSGASRGGGRYTRRPSTTDTPSPGG